MQNKEAEGRKIRIIVAVVAIIIAAGLAVYSYMILPEMVATQFKDFMNTGAPPVAKPIAVAVPFFVSTLFAIKSVSEPRSILLCLFGYLVNVLFWMSN